jgi:hypothetical protein
VSRKGVPNDFEDWRTLMFESFTSHREVRIELVEGILGSEHGGSNRP